MNNQLQELTSGVPKVIGAKGHAVVDYLTAGSFFAAWYALKHRNPAAASFACANGIAILGSSMLTDYPGGVWRVFSFKTHGMIDVGLTALAAVGPSILGFAKQPEGQFFHGQAAMEAGVVAATDFNAA